MSAPFAGGGGGGTNVAPPYVDDDCADAAGARTRAHANAIANTCINL